MGSPSLFRNYSVYNNWLFLKLIYTSRLRELGDPAISLLVPFMRRRLLVFYFVLFLGLLALFLDSFRRPCPR